MKSTTREIGILTVAAVQRGDGVTECLFNERQMVFTLPSTMKSLEGSSKLLKASLRKKAPVKVMLDTRRALVRSLGVPSPKELQEFRRHRTLLAKPDKVMSVDVARIDPTTFSIVDHYLKVATFRRCRRIVPNYKIAKKIFDFCAKQSCHLPGPKNISPCISFQYVGDGCFARAHKMRWIITRRYRYCCEKVFSFGNPLPSRLAVRATKWGGCCVKWWYHVAPLIRVRVGRLGALAMVIDPGMFDKPVLLGTWLSAQQNKPCYAHAKVTKFTIQPGSAYWPANSAGTAFGTDPFYTSTNSYLIKYKNWKTC